MGYTYNGFTRLLISKLFKFIVHEGFCKINSKPTADFKTFQVYSSSILNLNIFVAYLISKLFKFIVHYITLKVLKQLDEFQNFSSL